MSSVEEALDLSKLDDIIREVGGGKGIMIPVLQRAQDEYGYLPREVLHAVAEKLRVPVAQVYGVATFYAQFYLTRRGKNVIRFCDGTACHVRGAPKNIKVMAEKFELEPGATTPDYKFTMEVVYCLGGCALAPVAVLNGQVIGRTNPDKVNEIIASVN
jgi:NADH:ubiquinone oxidoreductase subunit E